VSVARRPKTKADVERGQRIKAAYEAAGFSRKQIAEAIGRYYHDVMRIEDGQKPDPETLCQIAELCGVTERFLVRGENYADEFTAWLASSAQSGLHPIERELLGSISFPSGCHPGPDWYGVALSAWRAGEQGGALHGSTPFLRLVAMLRPLAVVLVQALKDYDAEKRPEGPRK